MTETNVVIDVPQEVIAECLGAVYVWFEGEAVATGPVCDE